MGNGTMNTTEASAGLAARAADAMAKATPGPWHTVYLDSDGHDIRAAGRASCRSYQGRAVASHRNTIAMVPFCDADHDFDAALIAMAPDLAAEVIRLTQINAELTAANAALMVRVDEVERDADEQRTADYRAWQEAEYRAWRAGGAE